MKLKNSINVNTVSVGTAPLLPISQALLGQRGDVVEPPFDPASFDHAWSAKNKENTDAYKSILRNLKGNGVDMTLTNFGYTAGSGYENGTLVFDGVDDGANSNIGFEIGKDWTIIGNWQMLPVTANKTTGISKSASWFIYDYVTGLFVFVNSSSGGMGIPPNRSLKAVRSDGRMYTDDWTEIVNELDKNITGSTTPLYVGRNPNGTVFTPMNFRNLSIYNGQVLTKQQCIEAYDYLQTLSEDTVPFDPMSFDEAWTVRGMTNSSPTKETLNNLTGNGNNLTLSGFDYAPGSGYENGYLQFDGVKDGAISKPFYVGRRWTMVGEWEYTAEDHQSAGIVKSSQFFTYNSPSGLKVFINRASSPLTVPVKSLHAICSDGRMYDKDWNEIVDSTAGANPASAGAMLIGTNGTNFANMKFKNLAFYKDRVLTKEQAQLAYNTLQTL